MAAPKRTDFERENDYHRITAMYLQGRTQAEIAAMLGVSQQQISLDLATVQRRWRTDTAINLDEAKQKELARIDNLERTYWDAWQHSSGEHVKTRTEHLVPALDAESEGSEGEEKVEKKPILLKRITDTEDLVGAPAFLAGVMSCIERRCKLLGLDAPTKVAPTTPEGDKPYNDELSEERRISRLAAILNSARTRRDRLSTGDGPADLATAAGTAE